MSSSSPPAAAALKHVQASVIDGRAETARYRQDQLRSLHEALRAEAAPLCAALAQDSGSTAAEVEAEYFLAMDAVRHFYDSVDVQTALAEEYHVVEGKDNPGRRVAAGLVLVRPASHTRFFSIVSPLAAAVAAGNCVVVEVCGPACLCAAAHPRAHKCPVLSCKTPSSASIPSCGPS